MASQARNKSKGRRTGMYEEYSDDNDDGRHRSRRTHERRRRDEDRTAPRRGDDYSDDYSDDESTELYESSRASERPRTQGVERRNEDRETDISFREQRYATASRGDTSRQNPLPMQSIRRESEPEQVRAPPAPAAASAPHPGLLALQGLSEASRQFISKYPLEEFKSCARFVKANPDVLSVDTNALQKVATWAYSAGREDLAQQCVERLTMVQLCKNKSTSKTVNYIYDLSEKGSDYRAFREQYKRYEDIFSKSAKSTSQPQESTAAAPASTLFGTSGPRTSQSSLSAGLGSGPSSVNTIPALDRRTSIASSPGSVANMPTLGRTTSQGQTHGLPVRQQSIPEHGVYEQKPLSTLSPPQNTLFPQELPQSTIPSASQAGPTAPSVPTRSALYAQFFVREDARTFFVTGRVFKVLWHQPAGVDLYGKPSDGRAFVGKFNEPIHSSLRWMVVLVPKNGYCLCCPISTYSSNGLARKNLKEDEIRAHAIIHDSESRAMKLKGEPDMPKKPVMVELQAGAEAIHHASRIHFGKVHTVEWNVKVMNIGKVHRDHIPNIISYFDRELGVQLSSSDRR